MNDVGLLIELAKMGPKDILSDEDKIFKGMIAENFVAQMLVYSNKSLNYWKSKNDAEIDLLSIN